MSQVNKIEKAPRVFISYSHDTLAHKQWVGELATRLVEKGVEVILDQWDLGLGDDVPKFMERAVSEADRVLMICTEAYVRKANDGKGGVGYEAMVVTGELIQDLGTAKFIPIVRQEPGGHALPRCMSTRFWVNLSEGQNIDEQLETLLRELHKAPKLRKPALGKNPFENGVAISDQIAIASNEHFLEDASSAFRAGLVLAKSDDILAWRKLVNKMRDQLSAALIKWRKERVTGRLLTADLPKLVSECASVYSPIMSLGIAGIVSRTDRFSNQAGLIDVILKPEGWNLAAGLPVYNKIPEALVFTFQALHGAACVYTGQLMKGVMLSRTRVQGSYISDMKPLFQEQVFVGQPRSLLEREDLSLAYLTSLFDQLPWLKDIYVSAKEYRAALRAYYLALHIQELAYLLSTNKWKSSVQDANQPLVPLQWVLYSNEDSTAGYKLMIQDPDAVRWIWRSLGVKDSQMFEYWDPWITKSLEHMKIKPFDLRRTRMPHEELFEDIRPEEGK